MKYKQKVRGNIKQFKVKGLSLYFALKLRMSGDDCLILTNGEYSINWRNNIVGVITRDTVMKTI